MNPGKDEAVIGLNAMAELANMDLSGTLMLDALNSLDTQSSFEESDFPFNRRFIDTNPANPIKTAYEAPANNWRKIAYDWLSEVGRLSLYMDKLTNNTSLVLAFELVESKRVLLFVGDAQIGNWQSWFDVKFGDTAVTGEDLLKRTVLYKAGHHSSHNATLKQGLKRSVPSSALLCLNPKCSVAIIVKVKAAYCAPIPSNRMAANFNWISLLLPAKT
jgi:hypothetical protein